MSAIIDQFLTRVSETPAKTALIVGHDRRSYAELKANARRYAEKLSGIAEGRRLNVALALEDCIECIEIVLACLWSGHSVAIADPDWPASALAENFDGIGIDLLIAEEAAAPALEKVLGTVPVAPRDALHDWFDEISGAAFLPAGDDAPFLIGFTSGSTGKPKAFRRGQGSWCASFGASDHDLPTGPDDIVLCPGLMKHTLGLYAVLYAVLRGATAIGARQFGPTGPESHASGVLDLVAAERVTQLALIPPVAHWLGRAARRENRYFQTVRQVTTTSMKLADSTASLLKTYLPNAAVIEYYGSAETGFITVAKPDAAVPAASVGRAMHGVSISIRDAESGEELPPGEIGLVHMQSLYLSDGYIFEYDTGGFRFSANGWATVGDFGWLDDRGMLTLAGRENNLMISGGHKVYPAEIEAVIRDHTEVEAACVFGLPNPVWGDIVCLATAPRHARLKTLSTLCYDVLPPERCPQVHFPLDELPRTPTGKIALTTLRENLGRRYGTQLAGMTMGTLQATRKARAFIPIAARAE
ncbi:MAG: AMP-binding protein [Rhodobacter sp.]|nr:AMP-binding protein [Rhodobacter sp.]